MSLPSYSLSTIKKDIRSGNYFITNSARVNSIAIGFDAEDIKEIGLNLIESDFYKTMGSEKFLTRMQDVYRTEYRGIQVYYKVQITNRTIIISCKEL
ncbi:MAG: type II toxin-antitoxin system MqsR family toxin [Spirochaetaceae bacterium]|jgi:hypothetical protein|nr:type II toxin-antitoxin system MqsR family toxin [Spirochaetaceae bacterium]